MTATVMVFDGPGKPLRAESFPLPVLQPGELQVRVTACTVCGSDLHSYAGRRRVDTPHLLGHEIVGVVEQLGCGEPIVDEQGQPLRVGDRVVWSIIAHCGTCERCARGFVQKCRNMVKYGHRGAHGPVKLTGGLSTHCHLPRQARVFRVPDGLPDLVACQAGCATATAAACLRAAGDVRERSVLVYGAGLLGLSAAAMARDRGARRVVVTDRDRQRLAVAERFGATRLVPFHDAELWRGMVLETGWNGFDVALEMSGTTEAVMSAIDTLGLGGTAVLAGTVTPTKAAQLLPEQVVRGLLTIRGVHNYHPPDLAAALHFLAQGRYPFAELVTKTFPLSEADAAFRYAEEHRPIRVAVLPNP